MFHSCFHVYVFVKIPQLLIHFIGINSRLTYRYYPQLFFVLQKLFSLYLIRIFNYPSKSDFERFIPIFNTKPIAAIFVHIELPP